jgi:streptogramin lyase
MNLREDPMQKKPNSAWQLFLFHRHSCARFCGGIVLALTWFALSTAQAQTTNYALGTTTLVVGPTAGSNSVVLAVTPTTGVWTASANANWLHLGAANQNGTGSSIVVFSYDANPGATRCGTLTIAGLTLTVTQAGSTYVAAATVTTLVYPQTLPVLALGPCGMTVDGAGDAYTLFSGAGDGCFFEEWYRTNNTWNSFTPFGVDALRAGNVLAADSAGNIYIADAWNNAVKEWSPANSNVKTLVSSGLDYPMGVALDGAGNVYFADSGNNAIKEWTAANSNVTTLVSSGLDNPLGLAVDAAGNVYIADTYNNAIKEWNAASSNVTTLVSSGLDNPLGLAVDGAGNVYIANVEGGAILEWNAASSNVSALVSGGFTYPGGVAVDGAGNIYMAGYNSYIAELPHAFVDPAPRLEGPAASSDSLPVVLPATENLLPPFAPISDQSWLTITGVTNGVVSFSFTANTNSLRTGHITLLGLSIPITQGTQGMIGTPPALTNLQLLSNGVVQFAFTNIPGAVFTVLSASNLSLPLREWTVAGSATNIASNVFQFTSQPGANDVRRFYTVRSP